MNDLNIKNLFLNNNPPPKPTNSNVISISTIVATKSSGINDDFIVNKIKDKKQTIKDKINEINNKLFESCLNKINMAIDANLTSTIYKINSSYFGYPEYNPEECLKFIKHKLEKKNFVIKILYGNKIYIDWSTI